MLAVDNQTLHAGNPKSAKQIPSSVTTQHLFQITLYIVFFILFNSL